MDEYTRATLLQEEIKRGELLAKEKPVTKNYREAIQKGANKVKKKTLVETPVKESAISSVVQKEPKSKSLKDTTNELAKADNPMREMYRQKMKTEALPKLLPGGGDPMAMINPQSNAAPVEQPYDLLDRLAVDKRKADFRVRQQYALPVQSISQMTQAKNGQFVTVKTKFGRTKKTRIT